MLGNLVRDISEPYENELCFYSRRYLIVRKSDHLPLFDERFINYGYNKQQWVEHLRYIGYSLLNWFMVMALISHILRISIHIQEIPLE